MRIADVWVGVKADLSDFRRGMSELNKNASAGATSIGQSLSKIGAGMSRAGSAMTTSLTLPILAVGGATTKMALDFDTSLRQISGLTDVTAGELDGIREKVLALGPAVGKGPQELVDAFYFIASAGFKADEAFAVLETSAKAAAAGLGETQTIAQLLGGVINAYGKENITAARAADILTESVSQGTAEASGMATVMGNVVPGAAALGVEFEEVAAALAGMTLVGVGVEESATSLIQIFSSLQKPTTEAEDALKGLGLSSAELRRQLRDEGLLATLRVLEERFAGNETAAAAVFGNIRALRGVTALLTQDSDSLNAVFAKVADSTGRMEEAYTETEGPARDMARSMADLQGAAIELGTDLLPTVVDVLKQLAGAARGFGQWWSELDAGTKNLIVQMAIFLAAAGPVLSILGKLASGAGALFKGIGFLTGAKGIPLLIRGIGGLRLATLALLGPIGLLVAATLALKTASDFVQNWLGGVSDSTKEFADQVGMSAAIVNEGIEKLAGDLGLSYEQAEQAVRDYVDTTGAGFVEAVRAVQDGAYKIGLAQSAMNAGWAESWRGIGLITREGAREAVEQSEAIPEGIAVVLEDGALTVKPAAEEMVDPIDKALTAAIEDTGKRADEIIDALANSLAEGPEEIKDALGAIQDAIKNSYADTTRQLDLEGALAATVWADGLADQDSRVRADAALRLQGLLEQYELLAPGALAAGELVNPALQEGIDANLAALVTYMQNTAVPGITDPLDLAAVLTTMGYESLAGYIRGIEDQKTATERAAEGVRLRAKKALAFTAYEIGFTGGQTWVKGIAAGIANNMWLATIKVDDLMDYMAGAGSPLYTKFKKIAAGSAKAYMGTLGKELGRGLPSIDSMLSGMLAPSFGAGMSPTFAGGGGGWEKPAAAEKVGGNTYNVSLLAGPPVSTPQDIGRGLQQLGEAGLLDTDRGRARR